MRKVGEQRGVRSGLMVLGGAPIHWRTDSVADAAKLEVMAGELTRKVPGTVFTTNAPARKAPPTAAPTPPGSSQEAPADRPPPPHPAKPKAPPAFVVPPPFAPSPPPAKAPAIVGVPMPALLTRPETVITENNLSIVLPSTEDQMAEIKARYEETGVVEDFAKMTTTTPVQDLSLIHI